MHRLQVTLTQDQVVALRRLASERGQSIASVVRDGVDHVLRADDRRHRATEVVGAFASGRTDVAIRHDDHLDEAFGSP